MIQRLRQRSQGFVAATCSAVIPASTPGSPLSGHLGDASGRKPIEHPFGDLLAVIARDSVGMAQIDLSRSR